MSTVDPNAETLIDTAIDADAEPEDLYTRTIRYFLKPVAEYLDDPTVSEIMINGPSEVYVERKGKVHRVDSHFPSEQALLSGVKNIAQYVGRTLTGDVARFDARLPDGSRVHVTLPPCSRNGICVAIRKFSDVNFTVDNLVELGSLSAQGGKFLDFCVKLGKNLIVSGGTGSGKTSLLNALSGLMPAGDRILVLEDSSELKLQQEHVLYYECVAGDRNGRGRVTIRDLFHFALRMRPSRVVIGEIRGGEALDLIQVMTSGHSGSMSTVHANTPRDALNRLETLAMMGGLELPQRALRTQVSSAIDVIVQISRFRDGSRKIVEISEVLGLGEDGNYQCLPIFHYALDAPADGDAIQGALKWTGKEPTFLEEARLQGMNEDFSALVS